MQSIQDIVGLNVRILLGKYEGIDDELSEGFDEGSNDGVTLETRDGCREGFNEGVPIGSFDG